MFYQLFGLLGLVVVFAAGVYLEFLQHCFPETGLGQHALDGLGDDPLGVLLEHLCKRSALQTAGVSAVTRVDLVGQLVIASDANVSGVYNNHVIASVYVGRVFRAMLAHQNRCDLDSRSPEHFVRNIYYEPLAG